MKKIEFTQEELDDIHTMYQDGYSLLKIMDKYHVSQTVLERIWKENGWTRRNMYECHKKYHFNEHYFDVIDDPNKAYCMGLFFADGCNHMERRPEITIELQERDQQVLEEIRHLIESDRPLRFYGSSDKNHRSQGTCKLILRSQHLCEQMTRLGFIPRKSLTLDFPNWITPELFPYFLKGYIDGDGWIRPYRVGMMGTDCFCEGVKNYLMLHYGIDSHIIDLSSKYNEHTKTLYISHRKNLLPLTQLMFAQSTPCIPRKANKYLEYNFLTTNNSLAV